jgi:TrmH family RNA methyltransferase
MNGEIVSVQNPRVKVWAGLLEKKGRSEQQCYLLEGVHLVKEALLSDVPMETILYSLERGIPAELAPWKDDCRWVAVSEPVLAKCSSTKTPQAVVAVAQMVAPFADSLLSAPLVLVADGVQDPGNIGTMIRSAVAVGVDAVILGAGCADLYAPKTVRATMGALFQVPVLQVTQTSELVHLLQQVRASGTRVLVAALDGGATMYEVNWRERTWLVVGNEGSGVSPEIAAEASQNVYIPMSGQTESLNVAMAATVLLYEAYRQRR